MACVKRPKTLDGCMLVNSCCYPRSCSQPRSPGLGDGQRARGGAARRLVASRSREGSTGRRGASEQTEQITPTLKAKSRARGRILRLHGRAPRACGCPQGKKNRGPFQWRTVHEDHRSPRRPGGLPGGSARDRRGARRGRAAGAREMCRHVAIRVRAAAAGGCTRQHARCHAVGCRGDAAEHCLFRHGWARQR